MELIEAYIPIDRRLALAGGYPLPAYDEGAALFADISGFTPLTEALAQALGPRRGAEELTDAVNRVYGALIDELHRYGGTVISFSGDAMTCWLSGAQPAPRGAPPGHRTDAVARATACALAMQRAMAAFAAVPTPAGATVSLALKVGIAAGRVRRIVVGNPQSQLIDTLAGTIMERLAAAEQLAGSGEVVLDPAAAAALGDDLRGAALRRGPGGAAFAVVGGLRAPVAHAPWPDLPPEGLRPEALRPWLIPAVYERLQSGGGEFLAELRPAVALFLRFGGFDFDADPGADGQLDSYIRAVQAVFDRYDASLLQLTIGDKGCYIYGGFGALRSHEDDAARAAAAALELRTIAHPVVGGVQVGVSAGQMRAGAYGGPTRRTYGVLGDEVNGAARLMAAAAPGQILFSPLTRRLAGDRFAWAELPPVKLKGKQAPVSPFSLEGRLAGAGERGRAGPPVVGRQGELAHLSGLVTAAAAGAPRVLLIEGEAGIGKSRLLDEAAALAVARGMAVLRGGAQAMEQTTPYYPWRDVLRSAIGLADSDDLAAHRRHVEAWAAARAPELLDRLPLLNAVLPLGLAETGLTATLEPTDRPALLAELLNALLRRAGGGPPALLIEDAHWGDSRSWALALALARAAVAEQAPLLLAIAARPLGDEAPAELAALAALAGHGHLRLGPLGDEATLGLAAAHLGLAPAELPAELATFLRERAEGSPFLAEELALALREQGLIQIEGADGGARRAVVAPLAHLREALPRSVQGVVLARIDRLALEEQLTLKVGAVVGRSFTYQPLRAALEPTLARQGAALGGLLRSLTRRELLAAEGGADRSYLFRQSITRDVAYSTLLYAQRRSLHRLVAEWYERTYPGAEGAPYYGLLASHWEAAEAPARALHYLELAGAQALAACALPEARALFTHALAQLAALPPDPARAARLHIRLATALWHSGDPGAAQAELGRGAALAHQAGAPHTAAEALSLLGRVRVDSGDYAGARAALAEALGLAEALDDPGERLRATRYLATVALYEGDLDQAGRLLGASLAQARALDDRRAELSVLISLGILAMQASDLAAARAHSEAALGLAEAIGDRWHAAIVLANMGELAARAGRPDEARAFARRSVAIDRGIGNRAGVALTLVNLADMACASGDVAEAVATLREALPMSMASSNLFALCALHVVARAQLLCEEPELAAATLALTTTHPAGNEELRSQSRELAARAGLSLGSAPPDLVSAVADAQHWLAAQ